MTLKTYAIIGALASAFLPSWSQAQDTPAPLVEFKAMAPHLAMQLAEETLSACRDKGFQVAVTVVDRFGLVQAVLRDQYAGPHTIETSFRKAWTSVSFKIATSEFVDVTQSGERIAGLRHVSNVMAVGGGIPIEVAGSLIGGVGVSGGPSGDLDHKCAVEGLEAVAVALEF
ncbi:MAG: heme-binding protein [Alphaproteobacteria bacterium]|nr:heme-binding protein [Alphaproteobacteria bacterium]